MRALAWVLLCCRHMDTHSLRLQCPQHHGHRQPGDMHTAVLSCCSGCSDTKSYWDVYCHAHFLPKLSVISKGGACYPQGAHETVDIDVDAAPDAEGGKLLSSSATTTKPAHCNIHSFKKHRARSLLPVTMS